ncbi:hypothetical protein DND66_11250 [Escherichia coli]|nr:hypothetical protein [Escherichia coli]
MDVTRNKSFYFIVLRVKNKPVEGRLHRLRRWFLVQLAFYGLCFSAKRMITLINAAVCDRFLRIFHTGKIIEINHLPCGLRVVSPEKLRISRA